MITQMKTISVPWQYLDRYRATDPFTAGKPQARLSQS